MVPRRVVGAVLLAVLLGIGVLGQLLPTRTSPDGASPAVPGDVAWMLTATALVLLMTPGLSFFYGGMVRGKSIISTMLQSFIAMAVVTLVWIACFGRDRPRHQPTRRDDLRGRGRGGGAAVGAPQLGGSPMTVIVRRLTALVVVVTLLACEKKREEAPTPSAEDRAVEAAMARLAIPAGDRVQMAVWLVGAKEAGIARESRTGTCIVVAKSADGSWRAHAAFKGTPGAGDLKPPLTTAGTMQEGITLHDLELLAGLHCKA